MALITFVTSVNPCIQCSYLKTGAECQPFFAPARGQYEYQSRGHSALNMDGHIHLPNECGAGPADLGNPLDPEKSPDP